MTIRICAVILLLVNLALAGYIFAVETQAPPIVPTTDLNAGQIRLLPLPA